MNFFISNDLEQQLIRRAESGGYESVEDFLRALLSRNEDLGDKASRDEEFNQLLEQLAVEMKTPVLPPDFSRADIYFDHD